MYCCGIGRIIFRTVCLSLFLRESDIFRREIIQGFYLGELLHKAKTLKSGRPLAQMVSLSTWETWRPAEERPRHIIHQHNLPLTSEPHLLFLPSFIFHFIALERSSPDGPNSSPCLFLLRISQSKPRQRRAVQVPARSVK